MSRVIRGDRLSAYERWEMPSMDLDAELASAETADLAPSEPSLQPESEAEEKPASREATPPPTLEHLEAIEQQAQEEGFASGYQEGRKEGKEQGYKKGHQEGFDAGYQKGYQEGLAAGDEELRVRFDSFDQILNFMTRPLADLDAEVEQELVHLTTAIARKLVRRELKTSEGEIVATVREAVSLLPVSSQPVVVYLHPQDITLVQEALALRDKNDERGWRLQQDPSLSRGGCCVQSGASRIDASVEKRLGQAIATVLGDERQQFHD